MKVLKKLKEADWGGNKRKLPVYYSNSSWDDLNQKQQNKTAAFWHNLRKEVQVVQLTTSVTLTKAKSSAAAAPQTEAKGRSPNTTADDMCRLLHVMFDPANAGVRTKLTKGSLKRADLEASKNDDDPWAVLAANFNNYDEFKYQNEAVKYNEDGKKIQPFQARKPAFTKIAAKSYELDPTAEERPMRDGVWMKEKWCDMRNMLSKVYDNFTRSGRHDGGDDEEDDWHTESQAQDWTNFADRAAYVNVAIYSYCLLDRAQFDELGRSLPQGRDDGKGGEGAEKDRRRRRGKSSQTNRTRSGSQASGDDDLFAQMKKTAKTEKLRGQESLGTSGCLQHWPRSTRQQWISSSCLVAGSH
jgi:hypothetical protein